MRFKNPQTVRGLIGRGTPLADLFLQVRVNGDLALFKALNRLIVDAGAVDREFVDAHCEGFDELRRDLEALSWPDVEYATGLERVRDRARRRARGRVRADHRLLGDGADAAPQRRRDHPRDRQLPPAARQHRPSRRGALSRARPQQRAGRPHDGDLGAADRGLPRPARRRVRLRAAARARVRRREEHPGDARRAGARVHGARRQLPARRAGHERDRRRTPAAAADGARLDEAEPLAPRDRRPGADPAGARAERARRPGLGRAGRLGGGLDEPRARLARAARAGVGGRCARRWRSSAGSRAARSTARRRSRGTTSSPTTRAIRKQDRRGRAGLRALRGAARGRLRAAAPAARRAQVPDRDRPRAAVGEQARADPDRAGTAAAPVDALARPVQHDDLRAERPLSRA